jgi:hypothetical protein
VTPHKLALASLVCEDDGLFTVAVECLEEVVHADVGRADRAEILDLLVGSLALLGRLGDCVWVGFVAGDVERAVSGAAAAHLAKRVGDFVRLGWAGHPVLHPVFDVCVIEARVDESVDN